jgi:hypothetical protein
VYHRWTLQVDKSVVSLVDKEKMRAKLAAVYETIKAHFKANLAQRIADASVKAEEIAAAAKASNQVTNPCAFSCCLPACLLALPASIASVAASACFDNSTYVLTATRSLYLALQEVVVLSLEIGADGKVAKKIQDQLKAVHPTASFFLASLDDESEK